MEVGPKKDGNGVSGRSETQKQRIGLLLQDAHNKNTKLLSSFRASSRYKENADPRKNGTDLREFFDFWKTR